jgi:hypothetical protein
LAGIYDPNEEIGNVGDVNDKIETIDDSYEVVGANVSLDVDVNESVAHASSEVLDKAVELPSNDSLEPSVNENLQIVEQQVTVSEMDKVTSNQSELLIEDNAKSLLPVELLPPEHVVQHVVSYLNKAKATNQVQKCVVYLKSGLDQKYHDYIDNKELELAS